MPRKPAKPLFFPSRIFPANCQHGVASPLPLWQPGLTSVKIRKVNRLHTAGLDWPGDDGSGGLETTNSSSGSGARPCYKLRVLTHLVLAQAPRYQKPHFTDVKLRQQEAKFKVVELVKDREFEPSSLGPEFKRFITEPHRWIISTEGKTCVPEVEANLHSNAGSVSSPR